MKLSIIIVNYNSGAIIIDAIRSVFAHKGELDIQLIVVDNGSSDESVDTIKKQIKKSICLVEMGRNAGFASANNAGLKKAVGEYVLFLNPDTIMLEGALQTLTTYMDTHPEAGACGANLLDKNGQPQYSYAMLLPGWKMEWHGLFSNVFLCCKYHGSQTYNHTNLVLPVGYIMGADLMVRRKVLEQVGPMDEDFFLFYEETELCYRIHQAGYEIVNVPQARIIHLEGQTIDKLQIRQQQMMRSRDIYMHKCCSPAERFIANSILWLSSALRMIYFALAGNKEKVQFWAYTQRHITQS